MARKKNNFGYELKMYWEDGVTVACRYFHSQENAENYASQSEYNYDVVPLLWHEACAVRGWMD